MEALSQTKELLSSLAKEEAVPLAIIQDAMKKLEGDNPKTERADALLKALSEKPDLAPAMAERVENARNEIKEHKENSQQQENTVKRSVRM